MRAAILQLKISSSVVGRRYWTNRRPEILHLKKPKQFSDRISGHPISKVIMGNMITGYTRFTMRQDSEVEQLPFTHDKKYNFWALTSNTGNGYLKPDGNNLMAGGKADTNDATECEWIAKEVNKYGPEVIYWKFLTHDESKEIVATNKGISVSPVGTIKDDSNLFLPAPVVGALYQTLQPKETVTNNKFLGANGDGTMTLIINKSKPPIVALNPNPQTLFMAFQLD